MMRDKIADVPYMGTTIGRGVADAILAALPSMVVPLVWDGFRSGPYYIEVEAGGIAKLFCNSERDEDGNIDCMTGGYLTLVSIEDLKAAANAHYVAQIMAAFGIAEGGE